MSVLLVSCGYIPYHPLKRFVQVLPVGRCSVAGINGQAVTIQPMLLHRFAPRKMFHRASSAAPGNLAGSASSRASSPSASLTAVSTR